MDKPRTVVVVIIEEPTRDGIHYTPELFLTLEGAYAALRQHYEDLELPTEDDELLEWINEHCDGHVTIVENVALPAALVEVRP